MQERLKSMRRMLRVRETIRRQEEWKLAQGERELADLESAQRHLMEFMGAGDMVGGRLTELLARNASALSQRIAATERAQAEQAARVLEEARKTKLTERHRDRVAAAARREEENRDLAEWIERAATVTPKA